MILSMPTVPGNQSSTNSGCCTTSYTSFQAGNRTYVATLVGVSTTSTATKGPSTTTTSATETSYTQTSVPGGSFTYTPSSQVKILSMNATVTKSNSGIEWVTFSVVFQNTGSNSIDVTSGGTSLKSNVTSGTASIAKIRSPACEIPQMEIPVDPGASMEVSTPSCLNGFYYQLTASGSVNVSLVLSWSSGMTQGSTTITASFSLDY